MPFTFSHPAIVLPLCRLPRKWISATGLVAGSMTPDFEYFMRMKIQGHIGHTLPGILLFDLPAGLAMAFAFHLLVRNALFDNLPPFLRSRLTPLKEFHWIQHFRRYWPAVLLSIIVGAASHLFWDGFTHMNGFFVRLLPALKHPVHLIGITLPCCRVLQHTSTIAGAAFIAWVIGRMPYAQDAKTTPDGRYWPVVAALSFAISVVRITTGPQMDRIGNVAVSVIAAFLLSLALTPFLLRRPVPRT